MKKIIPILSLMTLISSLVFHSCKKGESITSPESSAPGGIEINAADSLGSMIKYLSATIGVKESDIGYDNKSRYFTIDGDMTMARSTVEDFMKITFDVKTLSAEKGTKLPAVSQRRTPYPVSSTRINNIRVKINCTTPNWIDAATRAIWNFNRQSLTSISTVRLVPVSSGTVDITIYESGTAHPDGRFADGDLPLSNGSPGPNVRIYNNHEGETLDKKVLVLTHELGHTIGLKHTNESVGDIISGTPTYDNWSFMNAPGSGNNYVLYKFEGFSKGDLDALRTLYPLTLGAWQSVSGQARRITSASGNQIYITDVTPNTSGDYKLLWRNTYNNPPTWESAGIGDIYGVKVVQGTGNDTYWINNAKQIFKFGYSFPYYVQLPGEANDITINNNGEVYIVSNTPSPSGGYLIMKWNGTSWDQFTSMGAKKIIVEAGINGRPVVIGGNDHVSIYNGSYWVETSSAIEAAEIGIDNFNGSIYNDCIYILTKALASPSGDHGIMRWTGVEWYPVPGAATSITVEAMHPWITNSSSQIFRHPTL